MAEQRQLICDAFKEMALVCEQIGTVLVPAVPWKEVWCCTEPVERALENFINLRGAVVSFSGAFLSYLARDEFRNKCVQVERGVRRWLRSARGAQETQRIFAQSHPDEFARKQEAENVDPTNVAIKDADLQLTISWARSMGNECLAMAESVCPGQTQETPRWEPQTDTLFFNRKLVRKYGRQAHNCRCVLDSFEAQGWPPVIKDPIVGPKDGTKVNDTVTTLNSKLKVIQFSAGGDGASFRWGIKTRKKQQTP